MTAAERYESVWNKFLVALKRDPSSCLSSLQVKYHINRRGMCKWMKEHSLSVREMKRQILADRKTLPEKRTCFSSEASTSMFIPVSTDMPALNLDPTEILTDISLTFPDGMQVSVKKGQFKGHSIPSQILSKGGSGMFGLNDGMRFYVCQRHVRMNLGINGLYKLVSQEMKLPPLSGAVFIFFSKNRQQVKLLRWDIDGFTLYQKRLERGTFEVPVFDPRKKACLMSYRTLSAIMSGISLQTIKYRKRMNLDFVADT